jgi:hypothetical protein
MPRQSLAALSVVPPPSPDTRPAPPPGLTARQKRDWARIVEAMPAIWFDRPTEQDMLVAYLSHAAEARKLERMIRRVDTSRLDTWSKLLFMRREETKAMANTATKLRLTPQSRWAPSVAQTAVAKLQNPWGTTVK